MYVLTELGYGLICQVKEKEKKCSLENALVEKSKSSTRNENGLVEGLLLFSMAINFISSKEDSNEIRTMHTRSDNMEIMIGSETDERIEDFYCEDIKKD